MADERSASRAPTQARRLGIVLALNVLLVAGLAVVGLLIGSLSLVAAAGDSAADASGLVLGLVAVHLRDRYGRAGATNVVALVNAALLLAVTVLVEREAVVRLLEGAPPVPGPPILVAAAATAVLLAVGAVVLGRGAGHEDLHMRSVLLDTVADGVAAAAVAVTGLVITATGGLFWLDPLVGGVIAVVVAVAAVRLLLDVIRAIRTGGVVDPDD